MDILKQTAHLPDNCLSACIYVFVCMEYARIVSVYVFVCGDNWLINISDSYEDFFLNEPLMGGSLTVYQHCCGCRHAIVHSPFRIKMIVSFVSHIKQTHTWTRTHKSIYTRFWIANANANAKKKRPYVICQRLPFTKNIYGHCLKSCHNHNFSGVGVYLCVLVCRLWLCYWWKLLRAWNNCQKRYRVSNVSRFPLVWKIYRLKNLQLIIVSSSINLHFFFFCLFGVVVPWIIFVLSSWRRFFFSSSYTSPPRGDSSLFFFFRSRHLNV